MLWVVFDQAAQEFIAGIALGHRRQSLFHSVHDVLRSDQRREDSGEVGLAAGHKPGVMIDLG